MALLGALSGRWRVRNEALLWLMFVTGFRVSEALSLRRRDLVQAGRLVDVVEVQSRYMKGARESRAVDLHQDGKDALGPWLAEMDALGWTDPADHVFRGFGPNAPLSRIQVWKIIRAAARRAGLTGKVACHSTRKSFVMELLPALDNNLRDVMEVTGHRRFDTLMAYIRGNDKRARAAVRGLRWRGKP